MSNIDFGPSVQDWARTRDEGKINKIIMGEDIMLLKTHLTPVQRARFEINKTLELFPPISNLPGEESIREELLKRVADMPELTILNPEAFAITLAFVKLYGTNIKGNLHRFDSPPWKSRQYEKSDILRYLRFLSDKKKIPKLTA